MTVAAPRSPDREFVRFAVPGTEREIWRTVVLEAPTPRGMRYVGVSYVGGPSPRYCVHRMPKGTEVRYATRARIHANDAWEQARGRTIHHNLWHDGTPDAARIASHHDSRDCHERAVPA